MIIYSPHRETLAEAMAECKEFESEEEMKAYIAAGWKGLFDVEDIVLNEEVSADERIGWEDVRLVCSKRFGAEDCIKMYGTPQCIGTCATIYPGSVK